MSKISKAEEERALSIRREAITIDGDCAIHGKISPFNAGFFKGVQGVINVAVVTTNSCTAYFGPDNFREGVRRISAIYNAVNNHPETLKLVSTVDDIYKAKKEGKVGIVPYFQGSGAVTSGAIKVHDTSLVEVLYRLGLRMMIPTYNWRTPLGDGCIERKPSGLSKYGIKVIEEMNRVGMIVDVSHCSDPGVQDCLEVSKDPIVMSHAHSRSLTDNPRNKTDEHLKAVAEKGGVVGAAAFSPILMNQRKKTDRPTIDDFFRHMEYLINLIGIDHVAIGSDVGEGDVDVPHDMMELHARVLSPEVYLECQKETWFAKDLDRHSIIMPNITKGLVARGYSDQDIKKVLGENWIRIYKRIWKPI